MNIIFTIALSGLNSHDIFDSALNLRLQQIIPEYVASYDLPS